jgi:CheY-like chemotaxis protein
MDQKAGLFTAFTQADTSTTRRFGGTGLGLTISKRLVEMMHGEIGVQSTAGEGSRFFFTARFGRQKEPAMRNLTRADFGHRRVLVVDDNLSAREILSDMLKGFNMRVDTVASAEEGLRAMYHALNDGSPYELVLMDWQMPGMDGIEAIRRIRSNPQSSQTPVIVMVTGYGREEVTSRVDEHELDSLLLKPVNASILFETLTSFYSSGGSADPASEKFSAATQNPIPPDRLSGRVLVVEDNPINQQVAREVLESFGLSVSTADTGLQAVEMIGSGSYDLVLMDIQMPEVDGYESTRRIRALEAGVQGSKPERKEETNGGKGGPGRIPVIAMTAHAMVGDREKCLKAGMDDHITKPIDPDVLFKTLAGWLERTTAGRTVKTPVDSEEQDWSLPAELAGFDLDAGLARIRGNRKLFFRLLMDFYGSQRHALQNIGQLIEEGEWEKARRAVHALKGVSGNLAAGGLFDSAVELEGVLKTAPDHDGGDLGSVLQAFREAFNLVMTSLESLGTFRPPSYFSPEAPIENLVDPEMVSESMDHLREMLLDGDPRSEEVAGRLQKALGERHRETISNLMREIDDFAFEEALETLASLERALRKDSA